MRNGVYFRRELGRWGRVFPLLFLNAAVAFAAPAVLLETTRLVPADGAPNGGFGRTVAIDGNIAVVGANTGRFTSPSLPGAVYVFERNAQGVWQQTAKLTRNATSAGDLFGIEIGVDGNVIVVGDSFFERAYVFEKQGTRWVRTAELGGAPEAGNGYKVAVNGDLIAISHAYDTGLSLYRRGTGGWQQVAYYSNGTYPNDAAYMGPSVDVTAGFAVHGSTSRVEEDYTPGPLFIYSPGAGGNWAAPTITSLLHPDEPQDFSEAVSISGNTVLASGLLYERGANGSWTLTSATTRGDVLDDNESTVIAGDGLYLFSRVHQRGPSGSWSRVAELTTTDLLTPTRIDSNSNRVVAASYPTGYTASTHPSGQAFLFELPATLDRPALLEDDFQDGNSRGWMPLGGSFSVISSGTSLVYRQANTAGNATAILANVNYGDQSIQADVIPRAFDGADRWFGLVTRYVDTSNYYYATARSGGGIQLKKMLGGSFTTLGSAPLTVTLNRTHRLRLEAVGAYVRVLVNERPVITVRDDDISGGQPGVMMYRTRADYDNVLVNANPGAPAFLEDFNGDGYRMDGSQGWWTREPAGPADDERIRQDYLSGAAHLITGGDGSNGTYGEQIVAADLRPTQFSGADRWIGLAANYVDADNYVYVTLRSSSTLHIKKLANGAIQTLASMPFPVATNTTYRVRLEAVGSRIRVYVNGELRLEASNTPNDGVAKRAGVMMYKTMATVDNFSLFQP